jgi:CheY-like chemotaxis protein
MGVWEAVDSPTAVAICHNHPIDLVFCDLNLHIEEPGQCQNGLEIIEELRHSHPHTPVYMVTADGSATLIEQVCAVGATGHLLKPINLRTVKRILVSHFSRNPEGDLS